MENFTRELKYVSWQLQLHNIIYNVKNSLDGFNKWTDMRKILQMYSKISPLKVSK